MACKTFHKGKYYVTFKRGFEDCKKDITVTIDKVFESDSLKILLSDDEDPTFLCVLNVTRCDYEDLKKQQGLLIDFDNFPSQLVRLLQQCASNNMFLIMQQTNPIQFYFEIIEHNEFKRLVHLSLKTGPATDTDIKLHMADSISSLKKSLSTLKLTSSSTEAILNDKCMNMERKIQDLSHALTKMEEDKLRRETEYQEALKQEKDRCAQTHPDDSQNTQDQSSLLRDIKKESFKIMKPLADSTNTQAQHFSSEDVENKPSTSKERLQWQRNTELNTKTQLAASQDTLNRKEKHIEELNTICKQLRDDIGQLEFQLSDKSQRVSLLEAEVQKTHIEVATLKAKNSSLERESMDKEKQNNVLNSRCTHLEKTIRENSDVIKDLNNSLHLIRKEKTSLEERLALSESLAARNNEAAHSTSEQLLKANQIISKQNSDLMEMKEKLMCRTAIALEQEKVIESNTKQIEGLKAEASIMMQSIDQLSKEMNSLKEKCESTENALKERDETIKNNNMVIQWLHKKMENISEPADMLQSKHKFGNPAATSSTPYFLSRNHTNSTEESIDFYATSKLSNVEDSPQPETQERISRLGLDPKYLKPATDDNPFSSKGNTKMKSVDLQTQKGKENKNVKLPKVDYREKKSARGSTYRATPVSAYFP